MDDFAERREALCQQLEQWLQRLRTMSTEADLSLIADWSHLLHQVQRTLPAAQEDSYRVFFDRAKTPQLLLDPLDGAIVMANIAAAEFYGYSQQQLVSMRISDINCLSPAQIQVEMDKAAAEQRSFFHFSHRLANGDIRQVEVHCGPIQLDGRALLYSLIYDLTERLSIEARLRHKSRRLQNILNGTRAGTWEWFLSTDQILINDYWAQMIGYQRAELQPITPARWQQLTAPEDWANASRIFAAHIAGTLPTVECEIRLRHRDGHWVWVLCRGQIMSYSAGGRALLMAGTHLDITAHKQAEQGLRESEARYRALHDSLPLGCLLQNASLTILSANQEAGRIFGVPADELVGTALADFGWMRLRADGSEMPPEEYPGVRCLNLCVPVHDAVMGIHRPGAEVVWLRVNCQPIFVPGTHQPYAVITTVQDTTAELRGQEALQLAASVFTAASEAIMITDAQGTIIKVNQAFSEMTGYAESEIVGENPRVLHSGYQDAAFYHQMWDALLNHGRWQGELWDRRKNGEVFAELATIDAVFDAQGVVRHYVCLASDISDRKQHQRQLELQANHDLLTGLPNRKLLYERLPMLMEQSIAAGERLMLAYIDLDGFKLVNDTYGHAVGDRLLITVSQRMRMMLREQDLLARIGGDEFIAVIQGHGSRQDALKLIKRLLRIVARPVVYSQVRLKISASIGLVCYPQAVQMTAERLIQQADAAMYQVKQQGKGGYCLAEEDEARDESVPTPES